MFKTYQMLIFVSLSLFCNITQQQQKDIPPNECPKYFQYYNDGSKYFGRITVPNESNNTELLVNLNQKQLVQTKDYGITLESMDPLIYKVKFPNSDEVPKLTKLTLNGQDLCISNEYDPPSTRLYLNHKLNQSIPVALYRPEEQNANTNSIKLIETSENKSSKIIPSQEPSQQAPPKFNQILAGGLNETVTQNLKCGESKTRQVSPLVYGGDVVMRGQYPWLTAIYIKSAGLRFLCGGSLVSTRTVISAAHCFKLSSITAERLVVNLGRHNLEDYSEKDVMPIWRYCIYKNRWITITYTQKTDSGLTTEFVANRMIQLWYPNVLVVGTEYSLRQPKFGCRYQITHVSKNVQLSQLKYSVITTESFDWRQIRLRTPNLNFYFSRFSSDISPICLWSGSADSNSLFGKTGIVAGWGSDTPGRTYTPVPKQVSISIVSDLECVSSSQVYTKLISQRTFCAGNRDGTGPCMGDSGSGLMIGRNGSWYLRGVVSAGQTVQQSCNLQEFVVFCDVAKHLEWVQSQMVP